jgi:DNA (cytosine-5)-methyltransferase 1
MNTLELFAGIGGLSLGLERAGCRVVGQVEKDPWATKILEKHWPEVPKHDDVRTALDWWRSKPRPHVDLVAGGYPCQGESLAGRRGGTYDERWLWPEFARFVSALRPRYVLGENVLGHRTKGLRFVLRDLELLGYTARAGTLSAGEVGAPHRRRRILVLAERADLSDAERELVRVESGRSGRPYGTGAALVGEHGPVRDVADAASGGRDTGAGSTGQERGDRTEERRESARRREAHAGWTVEPDVGRVAHGVPDRVDRLRGLGNAVVPAVGEAIGRLLLSGAWRD